VVAATFVGTGGCGEPSGAQPAGVAPEAWARSVCGALAPWRTQISDLTAKAQEQMRATKTAEQTKTNVVGLLSGAEQASETARRGVAGAGVPNVDNGADIAKRFTTSLTKARDAYGHAKVAVSGLATADANAFYTKVADAFRTLGTEYEASAVDLDNVGSPALQAAFDQVPECQ
jgi:hypothetical protein